MVNVGKENSLSYKGGKENKILCNILWITNVIVDKLVLLIPKNKSVWIFGSWVGQKYSDNSRYLYEYVRNKKYIKAYWITKNKKLYNKLRKKDTNILYFTSVKAIYIRLIAGVVFYTNSLLDIGNISLHSRGYLVALWHGVPLKRLYLDNNSYQKKGILYHIMARLKKYLYWDVKRDLTIICSPNTLNSYKTAFNIKNNKSICSTGQPRNDIFLNKKFSSININVLREKYNVNKVILYMPTYRSQIENLNNYSKLLESLFGDTKLDEILKDNNSVMLVKAHYFVDKFSSNSSNIIFLNDNEVEDVQKLMLYSDILVTDYSSCFIDFAILDRPIIFLANDIEAYEKSECGFYYDYREIAGNLLATDLEMFNLILSQILLDNFEWSNQIKYINNLFNIDKCNISSFSLNVFNEVKKRLSIVR